MRSSGHPNANFFDGRLQYQTAIQSDSHQHAAQRETSAVDFLPHRGAARGATVRVRVDVGPFGPDRNKGCLGGDFDDSALGWGADRYRPTRKPMRFHITWKRMGSGLKLVETNIAKALFAFASVYCLTTGTQIHFSYS